MQPMDAIYTAICDECEDSVQIRSTAPGEVFIPGEFTYKHRGHTITVQLTTPRSEAAVLDS